MSLQFFTGLDFRNSNVASQFIGSRSISRYRKLISPLQGATSQLIGSISRYLKAISLFRNATSHKKIISPGSGTISPAKKMISPGSGTISPAKKSYLAGQERYLPQKNHISRVRNDISRKKMISPGSGTISPREMSVLAITLLEFAVTLRITDHEK